MKTMPKKKAKNKTPQRKAKQKYEKPELVKHGVLSIIEGD